MTDIDHRVYIAALLMLEGLSEAEAYAVVDLLEVGNEQVH